VAAVGRLSDGCNAKHQVLISLFAITSSFVYISSYLLLEFSEPFPITSPLTLLTSEEAGARQKMTHNLMSAYVSDCARVATQACVSRMNCSDDDDHSRRQDSEISSVPRRRQMWRIKSGNSIQALKPNAYDVRSGSRQSMPDSRWMLAESDASVTLHNNVQGTVAGTGGCSSSEAVKSYKRPTKLRSEGTVELDIPSRPVAALWVISSTVLPPKAT
jgi:hypothetical protein